MAKWYVEYKAYNEVQYMGGIEAPDGTGAIRYVKDHVIGACCFRNVQRDDDAEAEGVHRGICYRL